jgi:hypothetical protein
MEPDLVAESFVFPHPKARKSIISANPEVRHRQARSIPPPRRPLIGTQLHASAFNDLGFDSDFRLSAEKCETKVGHRGALYFSGFRRRSCSSPIQTEQHSTRRFWSI